MKQTLAELSCLGLLLMGTAGVVMSLFVGGGAPRIHIMSMFAVVMLSACVAKWFLPTGQATSNG